MATHPVTIITNERLRKDAFRLIFSCESISRQAQPGQFLHIRVGENNGPLLRRPFSIHDIDPLSHTIRILYQVVGSGTRALARRTKGEVLDVMGPLGRGFRPEPGKARAMLIAGGIGIAPLPLLARELLRTGRQVEVLTGWRTAQSVTGIDELRVMGVPIAVATEDGNQGYSGTVVDLLTDRLSLQRSLLDEYAFHACGPKAMLVKVGEIARSHRIPCQVSLEERMACGIGACHGCAIQAPPGERNQPQYKLVCRDGPVFSLDEVMLE